MSRQGAWKLRLALLAGLCVAATAWAADDDDDAPAAPKKNVWVNTWFTPKPKKEANAPPLRAKAAKEAVKKAEPKPDAAGAKRSRELADYLRRLAVCDQLTQVAFDT